MGIRIMVWLRDEYDELYLVGEEAKYDNEDERLAAWQREKEAFQREKEEHAAALREGERRMQIGSFVGRTDDNQLILWS